MKKIGEGWQYSVYDLENGRVLKRFNSWPKRFWAIVKRIFPFNRYPIWKVPSYIRRTKEKAIKSFEILESNNIQREFIGNPKRLKGLDYEQDRLVPLHDFFAKSTLEENKKIVDKFIIFNQNLLKLGIVDRYFNVSKNFCLNEKGEIVLTDIGELMDNKEGILEQRKKRIWAVDYIAGCIKNKELRDYFVNQMDRSFGLNPER